jgi:predicted RNase H-like nuclease
MAGRQQSEAWSMRVVGVDGCPGGWVAVTWNTEAQAPEDILSACVFSSFMELLDANRDAAAIGVDIPIGLSEGEPRLCDLAARKVLGPRRSSVFPAPDPRILFEPTYQRAHGRLMDLTGKAISWQTFAICPKVAEVNWAIAWERQDRVFEIHPEVSFWALARRQPMQHRKKTAQGYEERRTHLENRLGTRVWSRIEAQSLPGTASADDVLDAVVAAWTARRAAECTAERLPVEPPVDRRGLRMEIVY